MVIFLGSSVFANSISAKLYKKACDKGEAEGCYNLGVMYDRGEGVKKSYPIAAKLYKKACDKGYATGCYNLGWMYKDGDGVKKSYLKAKKLFGKSCDMGNKEGCNLYNKLQNKDEMTADSLQDDIRQAEILNSGYHAYKKGNYSKARRIFQKLCNGGSAEGCFNIGLIYDKGQGVKKSYLKAKKFYSKACDGESAEGCYNLAFLYANGQGIKTDRIKGKELYHKACRLGLATGCETYNLLDKLGY